MEKTFARKLNKQGELMKNIFLYLIAFASLASCESRHHHHGSGGASFFETPSSQAGHAYVDSVNAAILAKKS